MLLSCVFLFLPKVVFAVNCDSKPSDFPDIEITSFWNQVSTACSAKITDSQNQQTTLTQAINTINSKINLAQAQINQTQAQINTLEKEVTVLGGVLETVGDSIDQLTKIYTARVRESYKEMRVTPVDLIFSANSIGDYFNKVKYLNTVKARDQLILSELEKSKNDYDQRKNDKVKKQKEVEALKAKLVTQQKTLAAQQRDKQDTLTQSKNDEKIYQQLYSDAQAQLAAIQRYVSGQGGASILNSTTKDDGSWGKYYNQRDSLWGNNYLGQSNVTLADAGCLVTSMAMIITHYGKSATPKDIASNVDNFASYYPTYLRQGDLTINGTVVNRTRIQSDKSYAKSSLDSELTKGKPVIIGVSPYGSSQPEHFIVVKSKDGDDYLINDPFIENGMNIKFSSHYSLSSLRVVDRVTVN